MDPPSRRSLPLPGGQEIPCPWRHWATEKNLNKAFLNLPWFMTSKPHSSLLIASAQLPISCSGSINTEKAVHLIVAVTQGSTRPRRRKVSFGSQLKRIQGYHGGRHRGRAWGDFVTLNLLSRSQELAVSGAELQYLREHPSVAFPLARLSCLSKPSTTFQNSITTWELSAQTHKLLWSISHLYRHMFWVFLVECSHHMKLILNKYRSVSLAQLYFVAGFCQEKRRLFLLRAPEEVVFTSGVPGKDS